VFAYAEALHHFERALDLWDQVPDAAALTGIDWPGLLERAAETASATACDDRAITHLRSAIAHLESVGAPPTRIGLLYERGSWFLDRAGRDREGAEMLRRAEALIPTEPPNSARCRVLVKLAADLSVNGRWTDAQRGAEVALEAARIVGARREEAIARNVLGTSLVGSGEQVDAGIEELQRSLSISRDIGDTEQVVMSATNLSDALMRVGRYQNAASIALDGVDAGRSGASRHDTGFLMLNAGEALLAAGEWDDCERMIGRALDLRAGDHVDFIAYARSALLHAWRGKFDDAATALSAADRLGAGSRQPQLSAMIGIARAHVALAKGGLPPAQRAIGQALDEVDNSEEANLILGLAALGLRIEADFAEVGRAQKDDRVRDAARAAARVLADRCHCAIRREPLSPEAADLALCEAELSRAEGRPDPERWHKAGDAFAATEQPHPVVYTKFREAEAVLAAGGDRGIAATALNAAYAGAVELGAVPLCMEIEALARRARMALVPAGSPDGSRALAEPSGPSSPPEAAVLGLTARELDVLRLVAAGRTNPQIAETLYISPKTAGHHVSSILSKLGVASRVEAAGIAHRLGLDRDADPK
jgi:DNA-binding CsgD family transcriptional regulator/tetratricopeptide (TPR) repeat protein